MSAWRLSRIPGRWTLTATASPEWRTARWTWPIEAAANDSVSKDRKTSSGGPPSSRATISRTCAYGNGRTSLRSLNSSSQYAGRQEVEAHRQHLAELDPRAAELARARAASGPGPGSRGPRRNGSRGRDVVAAEDVDDLPDWRGCRRAAEGIAA